MRIVIEGASEEFGRKLLEIVAEHRHELTVAVGTEWTVERAERYLSDLTAAALRFAWLVVEADGSKDADELRDAFGGELRGPTITLSRAVPRGVRRGWWPEGTPAPIQPLYDPANPSWQKAIRYVMDAEHLDAFREAFARIGATGRPSSASNSDGEEQS
ncbi:hypothetical protein ACFXC8_13530 [Streptomyces sp. NPDC059441]|uniref:hypothetical protein n=1 Tax=Streptomyces sp. NPDC059441 TaxID=3346829 RepID=UPI0036970F17